MSSVVVLDAGNSIIKARTLSGKESVFSHALVDLNEAQWNQIIQNNRGTAPDGFIRVNGVPYAFGNKAYQFKTITRLEGKAKYKKSYYGILAAISLAKLYTAPRDVIIFAAHPPREYTNRPEIANALKGDWFIEYMGKKVKFTVTGVDTFNEPEGGLFNAALNQDGVTYQNRVFEEGTTLVIDIGGLTTDFVAMESDFELNQAVRISENVGIINVIEDLQQTLYERFSKEFSGNIRFDMRQLHQSLKTKEYRGGGRVFNIADEVERAVNILLNRISDIYNTRAGGSMQWHTILLTGGGSAALLDHLNVVLEHNNIILAGSPAEMHMANVRGGSKLWRLYEAFEDAP